MSETTNAIKALVGIVSDMVDDLEQVERERDSAEARLALVVERLNEYLGGVFDEQPTETKSAEVRATKDFARQVLHIAQTGVR